MALTGNTFARAMMGSVALDFIENWQAPDDRYRSKYDQSPQLPARTLSNSDEILRGNAPPVFPVAPRKTGGAQTRED